MTPSPPGGAFAARSKLLTVFLAGLLIGAFSMVELVPAAKLQPSGVADAGSGDTVIDGTAGKAGTTAGKGGTTAGKGGSGTQSGSAAGGGPVTAPGAKCDRAHNGGKTDTGVTDSEIKLATTVVKSGIGAAFLGETTYAMDAKIREVNAKGGICGRQLKINYTDDGWDPQRGSQYLRTYINGDVFAIAVGASSNGVRVLLDNGDFGTTPDKGVPVVGTDGLEITQYMMKGSRAAQPWVWPVATASASSARIMVDEAYDRGARTFGIVFDKNYKFGAEAASAFHSEVKLKLKSDGVLGHNSENACVKLYCGITAGQPSYSSQVNEFYGNSVDFVALFLEPETALTWMRDANTKKASDRSIKFGYGAAQPLFTAQFESKCGDPCDGMVVWTGFKPDLGSYHSDPALRAYVDSLHSVKSDADQFNQFSQGGYVGMQLLVQALQQVGPTLTRKSLKQVLDSTTLAGGLTIQDKLTFTPSSRFANVTMQGFTMIYKGNPGGWRAGPIVRDLRPQEGAG